MRGTRRWVFAGLAACLVAAAGCDLLMAPPAEAPPTTTLSFAIQGLPEGNAARAFDRADRAYLLFTRPDSAQRDTIVPLTRSGNGSVARALLTLDTRDRVEALGIYAQLGAGPVGLFEGFAVVRIEVGGPTSAEIPLVPVPGRLAADRDALTIRVGDTAFLSSVLLFATGDTIAPGLGQWVSADPRVATVTPIGAVLATGPGQTVLRVGYRELSDSVRVTVTPR